MGYYRAGFRILGVDSAPQPHYPFDFLQGDAVEVLRFYVSRMCKPVAAIHASPPCKVHTALKHFSDPSHTDLVPDTRHWLRRSGLPYVIENVPGAPLLDPVRLCGSSFDLGVRRHRLFEASWKLTAPPCDHKGQAERSPGYMVARYHGGVKKVHWSPVLGVYGGGQGLGAGEVPLWRKAMGIDWMTRDELSQAIPPAYTEHIGQQLLAHLRGMTA